jgi:hypothetical protein
MANASRTMFPVMHAHGIRPVVVYRKEILYGRMIKRLGLRLTL